MFSVHRGQSTVISSVWKSEKTKSESGSQTEKISSNEIGTNHPKTGESFTQTDDQVSETSVQLSSSYDEAKLAKFIQNSLKVVFEEIDKSLKYNRIWESSLKYWTSHENVVKSVVKFENKQLSSNLAIGNDSGQSQSSSPSLKYEISSLCWNSSGTSIASAYFVPNHEDWCTHTAVICFWSFYQFRSKSTVKPTLVTEIEGCLTTVEPHHSIPSLFAVGTATGQVILITTRLSSESQESIVCKSSNLHQESVTCLQWFKRSNKVGVKCGVDLMSFGHDGRMILWQLEGSSNQQQLVPFRTHTLLLTDLPKAMGIKELTRKNSEVGITSVSFNPQNESNFLLGCVGGALFQCTLDNDDQSPPNVETVDCKAPIVLTYIHHRAHVQCVQFKPGSRNIFMSTGLDNEIRLYNVLHSKPTAVYHTDSNLTSAKWMPSTGSSIVATTESGLIVLFAVKPDFKSLIPFRSFALSDNYKTLTLCPNYFQSNSMVATTTSEQTVEVLDFGECLATIETQFG